MNVDGDVKDPTPLSRMYAGGRYGTYMSRKWHRSSRSETNWIGDKCNFSKVRNIRVPVLHSFQA